MRNIGSLSKEYMTDEEWKMFCHQMDMENSPSICSAWAVGMMKYAAAKYAINVTNPIFLAAIKVTLNKKTSFLI